MTIRPQTIVYGLGAFVLAVLGWLAGGWIVQAVALDELDLPARACGVFLTLSTGEAALARMSRHT